MTWQPQPFSVPSTPAAAAAVPLGEVSEEGPAGPHALRNFDRVAHGRVALGVALEPIVVVERGLVQQHIDPGRAVPARPELARPDEVLARPRVAAVAQQERSVRVIAARD